MCSGLGVHMSTKANCAAPFVAYNGAPNKIQLVLITVQLYLDLASQCFRPEAGQIQSQIFIFKQHKDISIPVPNMAMTFPMPPCWPQPPY